MTTTKPSKKNLGTNKIWRFLPLIETSGAVQMAIDAWLLQQCQQRNHPPTLRFYTWKPAAISLGYHQKRFPRHWQQLAQQGTLELVRRPTGGRAVLHQGDLTYAVILSGVTGKRLAIYERICQFLIEGWKQLGIELGYGNQGRGYRDVANCFQMATGADLVTSDGIKLIGSAQFYQGKTVLQHGSMQLNPNLRLFQQVFPDSPVPSPCSLSLPYQQLITTLKLAAQECFDMKLVTQPLVAREWEAILEIALQNQNSFCYW